MTQEVFPSGEMMIGCNYWASHAGIRMWSDWQEEVVAADFDRLAADGFKFLRVFPLWSDFQPLELLSGHAGRPSELSYRGGPFPDTPAGRAGIDPEMTARLHRLLDLAGERGIQVALGLVTGWMSGRTFAPPAFQGRALLTDPEVVMWQVKMVKYLVGEFHAHPALAAWGPGNECNCLGVVETRYQAWWWLATICEAIRSIDRLHPIASGMHSLEAGHPFRYGDQPAWMLEDQTELVDYFTTHPYPLFTPHARRDAITSFRSAFHAAAEGCFYSDIGGKPCISEELGTLAPLIGDDRAKSVYLRKVLYNLWTHDNRALLWWCAFDQDHLDFAPYDWNAVERQLGIYTRDGKRKPFADTLIDTSAAIRELHPGPLPRRRTDAVVISSLYQDAWGNGWAAFLLAKQAGFDVAFASGAHELPESRLYILPGVRGDGALSRRRYLALLEKVEAGASLYISLDDGILSPLNEVAGFESLGLGDRIAPAEFEFAGQRFRVESPSRLSIGELAPAARAVGVEADGNPVWLEAAYGRGKIFFSSLPLERALIGRPGAFEEAPYYLWYRHIGQEVLAARPLVSKTPEISVTLHPCSEGEIHAVAVNNGTARAELDTACAPGWRIESVRGPAVMEPGDAAFIKLIYQN